MYEQAVRADKGVDEVIKDVISHINEVREITVNVSPDSMKVNLDGILVVMADIDSNGMYLKMLPDVYTYSDFGDHIKPGTLKFNTSTIQSVSAQTNFTNFGEVLQTVEQSLINLNLYGYTVEE